MIDLSKRWDTTFWLPPRVRHALQRSGIVTLRQLCALTEMDFFGMRGVGEASYQSLIAKLKEKGLRLGMTFPDDQKGAELPHKGDLRDLFACAAICGMLVGDPFDSDIPWDTFAKRAYIVADKMLSAREVTVQP